VRTEMRCAMNRPPSTAMPVHRPWPRVPPRTVPIYLKKNSISLHMINMILIIKVFKFLNFVNRNLKLNT
jgi:hypothetical protein